VSSIVNVVSSQIVIDVPNNADVINVNDDVTLNVVNLNPTIQLLDNVINLNVESGGLVPSGGNDITLTAGTNLSALRIVTTDANGDAVYADNSSALLSVAIGITITSAGTGSQVTVATGGLVSDASWSWTKGSVYLGSNGFITQAAPSGGNVIVHIGRAISPTTIQIDIDTIIQTI
jgi:hypothetical protein